MLKLFTTLLVLYGTSTLVAADVCDSVPAFCTPTQVINCLRSVKFTDSYYKETIDDIVKSVEPYIYLDILKNPPQPDNFTDYFTPLDIVSELKKVPTENTNFYDFYRKTQEILIGAKDNHFVFQFFGNKQFDNKLMNFYLSLPVVLHADTNEYGQPIMKGVPLSGEFDVYDNYVNGAETKEIVTANVDVPIVSINGQSPFDFVLNFGGKYYNALKNFNARYTYAAQVVSVIPPVYYLPMDVADFTNITVVYENGMTFTSDVYFVNMPLLMGARRRRSVDGEDITDFARELFKNSPAGKPLGLKDVVKAFNSGEEIKERLSEREVAEQIKNVDLEKARARREARGVSGPATGLKWDFADKNGFIKCKVDTENQVNMYVITSFHPEDLEDYLEIVDSCFNKMDENDYPIIAITDNNGGGYILLSSVLQETLQPDMVARNFFAFKNDETTKKTMKDFIKDSGYNDPETCDAIETIDQLTAGAETDNFGNGVTHARTKPVLSDYGSLRTYMSSMKYNATHRRKPTEIIVFTDSYSFSAGSFFTKGLKEAGGAIIVGYNGYPGSTAETFDIGQSPTSVLMDKNILSLFNPTQYARLSSKGITFAAMSFGETFRPDDVYAKTSPLVPREFLVDPADERVPFYGAYNDEIYDVVVAISKTIFEKYKTECNPENPKLHMRDASCDAVINKEHMHGGFTCGADGKWTTTCEGYYCDDGYYFDSNTETCVKDLCYDKYYDSYSNVFTINVLLLLFIVFMMF